MPFMGIHGATPQVSEARARYLSASLSDALFTSTQQRVLSRLFGRPDLTFSVSELIHSTGGGSGAVQRELARLSGAGLLLVDTVGNQKRYRANPDAPIHDELISIVRKTFGLADPLREALAPLADRINHAFVYGSVAKRQDTAASDIDLMIVSDDLGYPEIMAALHPLIERLGRQVNPTLYTDAELKRKADAGNSFVARVLQQPRIDLIGGNDDLTAR
ncbi:MAG: transcriptional regulator [Xanthomonadales bacterium]|nr:transcriptional regulator [Xanthomonadales bacterium]